eukprot:1050179-Heterocapsa_arctica.AAC.1
MGLASFLERVCEYGVLTLVLVGLGQAKVTNPHLRTKVRHRQPSCYFHEKLKLCLVIYVDDFKLAGPTCNLKRAWTLPQE